ncbi:MAG TPA: muconolactone Delta-isomerase family protein [Candidatus Binatia bacterium]|jgi:muconolactone delta-isomerase|nr:muconolactone Delta-isomerase family protein [Candidatus Binatia bacterium]
MQFVVELRRMETPQGPPQMELALARQTFQQVASGQADPRIRAIYPYAGERAALLIVEVETADELSQVMGRLPLFPLVEAHYHPVTSIQSTLERIEEAEQQLAAMTGATTSR